MEEESRAVFPERLRVLLERPHMMQKDLAEALGERPTTVSAWLSGRNHPRLPKITQAGGLLRRQRGEPHKP